MNYTKPSISTFTTNYPKYLGEDYTEKLSEAIDKSFAIYASKIARLDRDIQDFAFQLAVCHFFQIECWVNMGYSSAPVELSSRNERVRFQKGNSILDDTHCGRELKAIFKANGNNVYVSRISQPYCAQSGGCGC